MPKVSHTLALGMVVNNFQKLELYLAIFTWGLMGKDQRIGQTITAQLSFSKVLALIDTLFRLRTSDASLVDELAAILAQAAESEQQRNRVIHSAYLQASGNADAQLIRYKVTAKLKKGLAIQWEQIPVSELLDIATDLHQTTEMLAAFVGRVRDKVGIDFSGYDGKTKKKKPRRSHRGGDVPF